jgi:DnaJ-class molecular chaperone
MVQRGAADANAMAERDPYQVLGVSREASDGEIKKAFRTLARRHHPDRNPNDSGAEARFKEVQSAYDKINTAEARREHEQSQMFGGMGGGNPFAGFGGGRGGGININMDDIFSQMFGSAGGAGQQRRPAQAQSQSREKGQDAAAFLDLSREEAKIGGQFRFTYTRLMPGSHGSIDRKKTTLKVTVDARVKHGKEIKLKGQGHGHPQGDAGDLIVRIRVDPGQGCRWDDGRVVKDIPLSYSLLMLGGKTEVTLPDGVKGRITIPPLSQIGDRQRVKDIDLEFVLDDSENLSKAQIAALNKLANVGL